MRRRRTWALFAALLAAAMPVATAAALLWTLVAAPLTTTVNVSTTFTFTATNLDPLTELGCLQVSVPASFVIESLGTPVASNKGTWASYRTGQVVTVLSLSGGGRLKRSESVQFTIRSHGTTAGTYLWQSYAHRPQDCSKTAEATAPLSVTVLPVIVPTPTPTPTPQLTASPVPTARPTPIATPKPILPLPSISLPGLPTLLPSASPTPTPTVGGSAAPSTSPQPTDSSPAAASSGPGGGSNGGASGGSGGAGGEALVVGRPSDNTGDGTELTIGGLDLFGAGYAWLVPSAVVAGPGLLVILFVLLQATGAIAWIPSVRRMGEESSERRRRLDA